MVNGTSDIFHMFLASHGSIVVMVHLFAELHPGLQPNRFLGKPVKPAREHSSLEFISAAFLEVPSHFGDVPNGPQLQF